MQIKNHVLLQIVLDVFNMVVQNVMQITNVLHVKQDFIYKMQPLQFVHNVNLDVLLVPEHKHVILVYLDINLKQINLHAFNAQIFHLIVKHVVKELHLNKSAQFVLNVQLHMY